jgi:glycosyltransferase involved in cell wall biosynthesis
MPGAIEIVHLALATFPADTRVKREALAALALGRQVAVLALRDDGQPAEEEVGGLTVVRLPGRKSRAGPLAYIAEYAAFTWRCRRLLARDPRFSGVRVVHVHTLPDFLVWAAVPAQRRGARLILDLHEIFPEFTASRYPGVLGRLGAALARRIERWARRRADLTITVNRPIDELLATRGIGRAERRLIVHNSADPEDFGPPRPPVSPPPPARSAIELIYHGTLTPLYGLDLAIRGVVLATERGVRVRLTILGSGPQRDGLGRLVAQLRAEALVSFQPRVRQAELPARLGGCDAGLVPTRLDGMTHYSLSNKLLEYVHLGLPVLAARLPSYAHYLPENAAWYWTPNDAADLARVIAEFAAAPPGERLARARRAQERLGSIAWPGERERLLAAYRELLQPA